MLPYILSYYHGRKRLKEVSHLLVYAGDYLVTSGKLDKLKLCVRGDDGTIHKLRIVKRRKDGKYIIEGDLQGFTNVEDLIAYYEVYGLTVKVTGPLGHVHWGLSSIIISGGNAEAAESAGAS